MNIAFFISKKPYNKEKLSKCYWSEIESYLINPNDEAIKYFADQVRAYLKKMEQKRRKLREKM